MSRYKNTIETDRHPDDLEDDIVHYLKKEGFTLIDRDENIWKKGMGLLLGPQYIQFDVYKGKLKLQAWIKFAILPWVYVGEMGIDGFFGVIPKKKLKVRVIAIEEMAEYEERD